MQCGRTQKSDQHVREESVRNVVIGVGISRYGHAVHECVSISDMVIGVTGKGVKEGGR